MIYELNINYITFPKQTCAFATITYSKNKELATWQAQLVSMLMLFYVVIETEGNTNRFLVLGLWSVVCIKHILPRQMSLVQSTDQNNTPQIH